MTTDRRLVIVVRADPVICGHSSEVEPWLPNLPGPVSEVDQHAPLG